jgi:hypothetical protein
VRLYLVMVVGWMQVSGVLVAGTRIVDEGVIGRRVVGVWDGTCMVVWYPLISVSLEEYG